MADTITCICGYRGPSVAEGPRAVCPICRTPAQGGLFRAPPPPVAAAAQAPAAPRPQAAPPIDGSAEPSEPKAYRINCPNGHPLKVRAAMLGQQAVCPKCNAVFVLQVEDSREYKKEQERLQDHRDAKMAQQWLRRAIWAAVFIVASLIGMIVLSFVYR